MGRKVLISFLGVSKIRSYLETTYSYDGKEKETSFVASALYDFLDIDTILLVGTPKSMWEAVYMEFAKKEDRDEQYSLELWESAENYKKGDDISGFNYEGLEKVLPKGSKIIPIHYGVTKDEIEKNFEIIADSLEQYLENGDSVYLDITHSFRSLPLFATTAISFIKDVTEKKIAFSGIYYGMLEAKSENDGKTPIVDLSYISSLQEWIKGAYAFSEFGRGRQIAKLMEEKKKGVYDKIERFTESLSLNYLNDIKAQIDIVKELKDEMTEYPEKLVIPPVFSNFIDRFKDCKSGSDYQFELTRWHLDKRNYALAYMCFLETIVTFVCEKEYDGYELLEADANYKRSEAKALLSKGDTYNLLKGMYRAVNITRNIIVHNAEQEFRKGNNSKKAVEKLRKYIKEFEKIREKYADKPN